MSDGLRLVLRGVCHAYRDLTVLQDIELIAEPGEVLVLVGPSGCGKSTLLGIMGGLLSPAAGSVRIDRPLAGRSAADRDLLQIEAELWRLIRDDAAAAEREIEHAPH